MTAPKRRRSLPEDGGGLLLAPGMDVLVDGLDAWSAETGIAAEHLVSTPLAAIPYPVWDDIDPGRRRWLGTKPEAMWHPLLWLPPRLARRHVFQDLVESVESWVVRVTLELTASGLYDPSDGGWVDVLATVDVDVDHELDRAQIADWLDGEPDSQLDDIDLAEYLDLPDRHWALEAARDLLPVLTSAAAAVTAGDLVDRIAAGDESAVELAHAVFASHSASHSVSQPPSPAGPDATGWPELSGELVDPAALSDWLDRIREENLPRLEELEQLLGGTEVDGHTATAGDTF